MIRRPNIPVGPKSGPAFSCLDSTLIDLMPMAAFVCEAPSGAVVRYNRRAAELWGREPLLADGTPMAEALHTGEPVRDREMVIERPDGSRRTVSVNIDCIRDESGKILGTVNVLQDFTERSQATAGQEPAAADRARAALRASELHYRRLLETLPAGAYTCDAEGLITFYNQQALQVWGRAPALNSSVDRFCGSFKLFASDGSPIAHDRCWMALALQTGHEYIGEEIVVERPDGTRATVLAHANPLRDERGTLLGAVNILVDITDRKRAVQELLEAGQRKDEFLAVLAHELRNPLAPIRNALQIMRLASDNRLAVDQARSMMERQVQQLVRLVDDLLDVSRLTRGIVKLKKERVTLASIVATAVETSRPLIESSRHKLTVSLPATPFELDADPTRMAQVLANLLNNAAKYMAPAGTICLTAAREGDTVVIQVRDTGIGIPAGMLPRVFDTFMQVQRSADRAQRGMGVGLTQVRTLVEMHGGSVAAHSDGVGKGSEFTVRLPLASGRRPAPTAGNEPSAAADSLPSRRVFVVDDNVDAAESLAALLRILGQEVRIAHDGNSALEAARSFRPDLVFLDIGLPDISGYELAQRIRHEPGGEKPVLVALTGWGQNEDRRRSREAGFDAHLTKPADPAVLQRLLGANRQSA